MLDEDGLIAGDFNAFGGEGNIFDNNADLIPQTERFGFNLLAEGAGAGPPIPARPGGAMRAGAIAVQTGLATANARWCGVDYLGFESSAAPGIHVLGDAIQIAPGMPKSGHMANQHGKTCAAAVVNLLQGKAPPQLPIYANTCYSFVTDEDVVHVASVHRYDAEKKTMLTVPGSGGLSASASALEGQYAMAWARNIWADTLA